MVTDRQIKQIDRLKVHGFSVKPLPLGGYLITDLAGSPMLATAYPHSPVHHLAPGNYVPLDQSPHQYAFEV